MRCKRHPYEGGAGLCAACLRDRLLALAVAQNEASSLPPPPPPPEPAPLFPRSVSPYVCLRKSDASGLWRHPPSLHFFRTPQVGPACGGGAGLEEGDIEFQIRRRRSRFSVLSALFGHSARHHGSEKKGGGEERKHRSWLAGIIPRVRRKEDPVAASPTSPQRRSCRAISNRGLSPARCSYEGSEECTSPAKSPWRPSPSLMRKTPCRRLLGGVTSGVSGFAVCISPLVRPTPGTSPAKSPWRPSPSLMRKTPCRRLLGGATSGVSGFAVCISPLVRPTPGRHHRGGHPPDAPALCSDFRPSPLHQLSSGSSLPHCRSWKLADGGRFR